MTPRTCESCHYGVARERDTGCMRRKTYVHHAASEPPEYGFLASMETVDAGVIWRGSLQRVEGDVCGPQFTHWVKRKAGKL
jgi:hypothetical protein